MKHLPCIRQYVPVLGKHLKSIISFTNHLTNITDDNIYLLFFGHFTSKLDSQPLITGEKWIQIFVLQATHT